MTEVINKKDGSIQGYTLDPKTALVCAFEQSKGNFNTWDYKSPDKYGIVETEKSVSLGDFFC